MGQAAPIWQANISDVFQHQRWGAPAAVGADPGGDLEWEATYFPVSKTVKFGGWCFNAATVNQLYHFRQEGKRSFGPPGGAATNPANVKALEDELKEFVSDFGTNAGIGESRLKVVNDVLEARGAGKTAGVKNGLMAQNFKQVGNTVKYVSALGKEHNLGKATLFNHIPTLFKDKGTANLRLAHAFNFADRKGTPQEALWWAGVKPDEGNFHSVTIAGYDKAGDGTIFFADPDSNPTGAGANGNRDDNGGWNPSVANWRAAPAGVGAPAVKLRRFDEATPAGVPVPAGAVPTAAEQSKLYFTGTLAATKKEFAIADANFDRYDGVDIRYLDTIELFKAAPKPPVIPAAGGGSASLSHIFEISPADALAENIMNEFWLFPASADEMISAVDVSDSAWSVSILPPGFVDPWGNNVHDYGGIYATTDLPGSELAGLEALDLLYDTVGGSQVSAWDFAYNDKTDFTLESFSVQAFGDLAGYNLPVFQSVIPEPASFMLALIGLGTLLHYSKRKRGALLSAAC